MALDDILRGTFRQAFEDAARRQFGDRVRLNLDATDAVVGQVLAIAPVALDAQFARIDDVHNQIIGGIYIANAGPSLRGGFYSLRPNRQSGSWQLEVLDGDRVVSTARHLRFVPTSTRFERSEAFVLPGSAVFILGGIIIGMIIMAVIDEIND